MDYARGIMLLAAKVSGIKKQAQKMGHPEGCPSQEGNGPETILARIV